MIQTLEQLASYIRNTLRRRAECRVFGYVLENCWGRQYPLKEKEIVAFAQNHGWEVKIHEPAAFGIVADFVAGGGGIAR